MQPFAYLQELSVLHDQWQRFITSGETDQSNDPLVTLSWLRIAPILSPYSVPRLRAIQQDNLSRILDQSFLLRMLAQPLLEDIRQFTENSKTAIMLLDSNLCILDMVAEPTLANTLSAMGITQGVYLSEGAIGTTAFSIAQLDAVPSWVYGPEHFLEWMHTYSTVAAPVYNTSGALCGVVGIIEPVGQSTIQSLGTVTVAARTVEAQIQADLGRREADTRTAQINSIIDAMSDGLLVWDASYMVTHINNQGSKLLDLSKTRMVGRKLTEFLQLPEVVATAVRNDADLVDTECSFNLGGQSHNFIINLRSNRALDQHLHLLTFRPVEEVRALVSKQVGAVARQTIDNLIGESKEMHQVRRQTQAAARGSAPVLVEGETGTGKATIARAIHQSSPRSDGPFVHINCRAIPRELTLSEFLGFQAGAYTNINQGGQPSKFELAHSGTLFLDEIDALSLDMQSALLSVIETSIVVRLGAQQPIPVDIRIIASTTAHLDEAMHDGGFRSDLYYRLRSFHIRTIPLRERQDDIPLLVQQKLSVLSRQIGHPLSLSDAALNAIYAYPWPGNIRELESALERAVVMGETSTIEEQHLPRIVREGRVLTQFGTVEPVYSLEEVEQMAITRACRAANGNMSKAARMLGIGRATLYRKLEAMNLWAQDFIEST